MDGYDADLDGDEALTAMPVICYLFYTVVISLPGVLISSQTSAQIYTKGLLFYLYKRWKYTF